MRDTVDPDFASFVDARQGRWLRTAYLVYGDLHRAEAVLLHAFTQLSTRWPRVDDPDIFVQRQLYLPALRPWNRAKPFEGAEGQVELALAELTPAQRAVFVLLHLEELTEFEVADLLGMSQTAVHTHALTAFGIFRTALGAGDRRDAR